MPQTPQITAALPTLVVVSGTASGLGTHIAKQLVGSGVMTIGVDIAVAPSGMNNLYVHVQGDVARGGALGGGPCRNQKSESR